MCTKKLEQLSTRIFNVIRDVGKCHIRQRCIFTLANKKTNGLIANV